MLDLAASSRFAWTLTILRLAGLSAGLCWPLADPHRSCHRNSARECRCGSQASPSSQRARRRARPTPQGRSRLLLDTPPLRAVASQPPPHGLYRHALSDPQAYVWVALHADAVVMSRAIQADLACGTVGYLSVMAM
ncbi:hypothetical protein BC831DRAFT_451945, partial [Entophlyctis helioformis]